MAHDEAAHDGVIGDDLPSPTDVDWSHSGAGTAHAKRNEHVSSSKMRNDGDEDLSREATSSDSYGIDTVGAPGYNTDITQLVRDLISQIDGLEDRVARLETHCGLGPAACGTATSMGKRKRSDLATQRGRKRRSRRRDEFTRTERAPSNSSGTHYNIDRANDTDRSDDEFTIPPLTENVLGQSFSNSEEFRRFATGEIDTAEAVDIEKEEGSQRPGEA